jgi:uncharacterized protein (TIGR02391 family)
MDFIFEHLHCGENLLASLDSEIQELSSVLSSHVWSPDFSITTTTTTLRHQAAYNRSLSIALSEHGWRLQPLLSTSPLLLGDFAKGLIFGEIQFGDIVSLYRDFYKFQYGLKNGLLKLAVLIVPHDEYKFFPTSPASVKDMANFPLALRYFTVLPITVPTIIYGLLADNEDVSNQSIQPRRTISDAQAAADHLRRKLTDRVVHPDVLKFARAELVEGNYFHAVLEAAKSVAQKIRDKTGLTSDGSDLIKDAFEIGEKQYPVLAFNALSTDSERREHNGLMSLMKGFFGTFLNLTAHAPRIARKITEQDALEMMTFASLLHQRLDEAVKTGA